MYSLAIRNYCLYIWQCDRRQRALILNLGDFLSFMASQVSTIPAQQFLTTNKQGLVVQMVLCAPSPLAAELSTLESE